LAVYTVHIHSCQGKIYHKSYSPISYSRGATEAVTLKALLPSPPASRDKTQAELKGMVAGKREGRARRAC
jgi:hypothetical protein